MKADIPKVPYRHMWHLLRLNADNKYLSDRYFRSLARKAVAAVDEKIKQANAYDENTTTYTLDSSLDLSAYQNIRIQINEPRS
jgi:hypothetical protein